MNELGRELTFLFTDIEGSTRQWEAHPKAMESALRTHDQLLREVIEASHGHVFKTAGDGFLATFDRASDAIEAAHRGQKSLASQTWPEEIVMKVRFALHTGAAEERDGDYFGPALNRTARLVNAAHGGQILVSASTEALCHDLLPTGTSLKSLDEHRLKDLSQPQTVFQLSVEGLSDEFPPILSLEGKPNNLPIQLSSFIGRHVEILEIEGLFKDSRLVTLTGAGGSGKTRLALQVAAELLEGFKDGAFLIDLSAITDASQVTRAVAQVLNVQEEGQESLLDALKRRLAKRQMLLIIDNCEQVLKVCAEITDGLLVSCPNLKILTTSREPLTISGETTYRVPPLGLPEITDEPNVVSAQEAARLFVSRARLQDQKFAVSKENARAIAGICHQLDGMPLAIELAAARVNVLAPKEIESRLAQRFSLLKSSGHSRLPRHQTLRSLIDWSWNLLSEQEQILFRRLAVFTGGWTMEAAEQVASGDGLDDFEVLDLLASLVDKSLVITEPSETGTRYRYLITVHAYAIEKLDESGEGPTTRDRHVVFFEHCASEFDPVGPSSAALEWFGKMDRDHQNILASLDWAKDRETCFMNGLGLAGYMRYFWSIRSYLGIGLAKCIPFLQENLPNTFEKARVYECANLMAHFLGQLDLAETYGEIALKAFEELHDEIGKGRVLCMLGNLESGRGNYERAGEYYIDSLKISQTAGHFRNQVSVLCNLQRNQFAVDPQHKDLKYAQEALDICRANDVRGTPLGGILLVFGETCLEQGKPIEADEYLHECKQVYREFGDNRRAAAASIVLAVAQVESGYIIEGVKSTRDSLNLVCSGGVIQGRITVSEIAIVFNRIGDSATSITLVSAGERHFNKFQFTEVPRDAQVLLNEVEMAKAALNDSAAFEAAWAKGQQMSLDAAFAYALDQLDELEASGHLKDLATEAQRD